MTNTLRLFYSNSDDPWFNLAVEEVIFRQMSPSQRVLFLWRNNNVVVIGRAQNPWKECNTAKMTQDNIKLARRSSGGGAVFQDLGNSCFTFMTGKPEYDKTVSTQIILNALAIMGVQAKASGRNDIVIETAEGDRKISGSAYKETADRGFHHGTLLIHANMTRLADYLNPDPKKLQAKGITSVRSRVANLNEYYPHITHQQFCQATTRAFFDYYHEQVEVEYIDPDHLPDLLHFEDIYQKQRSWQWNYGQAPQFSHQLNERFAWGGVDIHFDVENGHISAAKIFTDSLQPTPFETLAGRLVGIPYHSDAIKLACQPLIEHYFENRQELTEFQQWLANAIQ